MPNGEESGIFDWHPDMPPILHFGSPTPLDPKPKIVKRKKRKKVK